MTIIILDKNNKSNIYLIIEYNNNLFLFLLELWGDDFLLIFSDIDCTSLFIRFRSIALVLF